jgi:transcriptional regulator with PAS, ATPase and Fis domain
MQRVYELILKAANSDASGVIFGESGTGKELVAKAIHRLSPRAEKPFVAVNCGAIPEQLAESEFFGHKKGAFTGAHTDKHGYLYVANGGTLFLDEVGELDVNIQVKFLRAFETGEYSPIGDTKTYTSDFRLISATNKDLAQLVAEGKMREDFYYRISVIPIYIPPLRERKEDIPLLVEHFLRIYSKGKHPPSLPAKYMDLLMNYDWPGNVRELQGMIQRYLSTGSFQFLGNKSSDFSDETDYSKLGTLKSAVSEFEKRLILKALEENRWHKGKVASLLGIDPKTLYRKMKRYGILS